MTKPLPGVAHYPEHWPEEWWSTDARMMRDAGLSVVRIAGRDRHSQSYSTHMAHL
jgi:beta-galactosidase GanA